MRGEETQIAGFLRRDPGYDGVLCLPGTHSKWVLISAGEIVGFQTVMTGEVFALLATQSVLRHTTGDATVEAAAFDTGVSQALARPEALTARLFSLRAEPLLTGLGPAAARSRLSGLLIGSELAAVKSWWLGRRVTLIGAPDLAELYARALAAQGVAAERTDAAGLTLDGLRAARDLQGSAT
jgi:2-dehydro-3-deoxygalactonokinase